MKKNKGFRALIERSLWSFDRPREYFLEGSFVLNPLIIETRFRVMLKLFKELNVRPTKELADDIDNYVSMIAISGFPKERQVEGAFWGIAFAQYMSHMRRTVSLSQAFEMESIESVDDLERFNKSLDKMYSRYSEPQRKEMLSSLKKFGELHSPSTNCNLAPRIYTLDNCVSLPPSYAAWHWAEEKEEEEREAKLP